ncbi:MAG TPA: helix-turn-helix domain-containing protein [Verrucomicrobiae bacterium]|jgi:DNA-binding HxlR family transcriptional regulator
MKKADKNEISCSIWRAIEKIGDSWSLLILRDLGNGVVHFDEFQKSLGIAPGVLSKRLSALVEGGLVRKEIYQTNPPRAKYVLTEVGEDFLPVLAVFMAWGNKHSSPNGIDTQLVDRETHKKISPIVVDAKTGKPIDFGKIVYAGGPANTPEKIRLLKDRGMPLAAAK